MEELIYKALWLSIEDYAGLWELVWEINSASPDSVGTVNENRAKAIALELVGRGWVTLYRAHGANGAVRPLPDSVAESLLNDPDSWLPPEDLDAETLRLGATDAGEKAYAEQRM